MQQRGFTPVHQAVELARAMGLRWTRTNRSAYCLCQGFDSMLKNLDQSSLLIFSIFSYLLGLEWPDVFPISIYIIFSTDSKHYIRASHLYHRCRGAGRNQHVEEHKYTHTYKQQVNCLLQHKTVFFKTTLMRKTLFTQFFLLYCFIQRLLRMYLTHLLPASKQSRAFSCCCHCKQLFVAKQITSFLHH